MTLASSSIEAPPASAVARPSIAELFAAHLRFVWRVLLAYGVREPDAEDATQEVFIVAHRRMESWDPARASARTWLHAIAVRTAANYRRLAHVRREQSEGVVEPVARADADDSIDTARLLEQLSRELERIDEKKRAVFVLHEIEELPMSEVAAIVGCPVKTAYARYYAAQRELAAALAQDGGQR